MSQEDYSKHTIIKKTSQVSLAEGINFLSEVMDEDCESQRTQRVGYDWIIVEIGALGEMNSVVMDTYHFSDQFPKTNKN